MIRALLRRLRPSRGATLRQREELHQYWRSPDVGNLPADYAEADPRRGELLLSLLATAGLGTDAAVLEIGCNVGRNLAQLYEAGWRRLSAIEISSSAIAEMGRRYPDAVAATTIHNLPVEDAIGPMADGAYDLVFTVAVLEHIHPDSEWIFAEMARISRLAVITVEDEGGVGERHVPRDYGKVFRSLGYDEIYVDHKVHIRTDLPSTFVARVFRRS